MNRYFVAALCSVVLFGGCVTTESKSETQESSSPGTACLTCNVEEGSSVRGADAVQANYLDETNRLLSPGGPRWVPTPKRVRVYFGGQVIADSTNVHLLRESAVPAYYFPESDVKTSLLVPSRLVRNSHIRGDASFWSVKV